MLLNWATWPFFNLHTRAPIGLYTEVLRLSSRVLRTEEGAVSRGAFLAQIQRSMETTTYITAGEAKRGDEWDRSRERQKAWKHAGCVRREECSQRCSQGCWAGRRRWAKLRGWLLGSSSAWLVNSRGLSVPHLFTQHKCNCSRPSFSAAPCSYARFWAPASLFISVPSSFFSALTSVNIDSAPSSTGF